MICSSPVRQCHSENAIRMNWEMLAHLLGCAGTSGSVWCLGFLSGLVSEISAMERSSDLFGPHCSVFMSGITPGIFCLYFFRIESASSSQANAVALSPRLISLWSCRVGSGLPDEPFKGLIRVYLILSYLILSGKEGFGVKKPPISHHLRKRRFESENPHFFWKTPFGTLRCQDFLTGLAKTYVKRGDGTP